MVLSSRSSRTTTLGFSSSTSIFFFIFSNFFEISFPNSLFSSDFNGSQCSIAMSSHKLSSLKINSWESFVPTTNVLNSICFSLSIALFASSSSSAKTLSQTSQYFVLLFLIFRFFNIFSALSLFVKPCPSAPNCLPKQFRHISFFSRISFAVSRISFEEKPSFVFLDFIQYMWVWYFNGYPPCSVSLKITSSIIMVPPIKFPRPKTFGPSAEGISIKS